MKDSRTCWYGAPCQDTAYCIHPDPSAQGGCQPPAAPSAVDLALARATAPVADKNNGWETTAAILAYEVSRLRELCCPLDCPFCHDGCGCSEDRNPDN